MSTIIPFGPQHPVLPEPLHLKITLKDEIVTEAVPMLGYVHRGLETLVSLKDVDQMVQVVERVCGICSCIHAHTYCMCVEGLLGIEVPQRADFLRIIWSELHRMHSHLLWLGLLADAFGMESLFMHCWRIRERVMDVMEATAGNRVIISVNKVGGVRRDLSADQIRWIRQVIDELEAELDKIKPVLTNDYTVKKRTVGVGVLTKEQAYELGAVGPVLRGSGVAQDARMTGYGAYKYVDFEPVVETDGDSWARTMVRFRELYQAIDIVRQLINKLPDGEISVKVKAAKPEGEIVCRSEQPRGELMYYVKGNGSKFLERVRIRTPTFANVPPLLAMLPGIEMADVPVVALSIDPCISCTER
jgi:ech hydrogenase subunit E